MNGGRARGQARPRLGGVPPLARAIALVLLLSSAGLLVSGCVLDSFGSLGRVATVRENAEGYAEALRWGRVREAAARVAPQHRAAFLELFEDPKDAIHFTDFEIVTVEETEQPERIEVLVTFELYHPPYVEQQTVREKQVWVLDGELGGWYLEPELAAFRATRPAAPASRGAKPDVSSGGN